MPLPLLKLMDLIQIAIVAVNTFLHIDSIFKSIATYDLPPVKHPVGRDRYSFGIFTIAPNGTRTTGAINDCINENGNYDNAISVTFSCPYLGAPAFIGVMSAWGGYYFVLIATRLVASLKYSYDDYRYVFYVDQFNSRLPSRILFVLGVMATLATAGVGIAYASEEGNAGQVYASVMFAILNILGLNFGSCFCRNPDAAAILEEQFPDKIRVKELPGGNGLLNMIPMLLQSKALFLELEIALATTMSGKTDVLARITENPQQLRAVMTLLAVDPEAEAAAAAAAASEPTAAPVVEHELQAVAPPAEPNADKAVEQS